MSLYYATYVWRQEISLQANQLLVHLWLLLLRIHVHDIVCLLPIIFHCLH